LENRGKKPANARETISGPEPLTEQKKRGGVEEIGAERKMAKEVSKKKKKRKIRGKNPLPGK